MSEDQVKKEEELKDEALEVAEEGLEAVEEEIEEDALTEEEMDEFDEVEGEEEEEEKEIGAVMVIGQGDFSVREANRGADDPGDNTLSEPQFVCRYGDMLFVTDWGNHRVLAWNQFPEENGEPASLVLGQEDFSDCLENRGISTTLDEMTSGLGDENLEGFTISKPEEDTCRHRRELPSLTENCMCPTAATIVCFAGTACPPRTVKSRVSFWARTTWNAAKPTGAGWSGPDPCFSPSPSAPATTSM